MHCRRRASPRLRLCGEIGVDASRPPGPARDLERAAHEAHAGDHAAQPEPAPAGWLAASDLGGVEAAAVVLDAQLHAALAGAHGDAEPVGPAVADGVRQRLLDDPEGRLGDARIGARPGPLGEVELDLDALAPDDQVDLLAEELVERGRSGLAGGEPRDDVLDV